MTNKCSWTLVSLVLLVACGDDGNAPGNTNADASMPRNRDAGSCISDLECADGLFCNGAELCDPGAADADAFGCVAARRMPTCDDGIACTTDSCSDSLNRCDYRAVDADDDGHGDINCEDALGDSLGDDCADDDANRYPGNVEVCDFDKHDEDCDIDTFGERDRDGDGEVDAMCCNRVGTVEVCGSDCNDLSIAQRSKQPEFCDTVDNDCDGIVDEEAGEVPWYRDEDHDNFGDSGFDPTLSCIPIPGASLLNNDCDDADGSRHRAQIEICDFIDNDCDGLIDEPAYCNQGGGVIVPDGGVSGSGGSGGASGSGGMSGTGGTGGTSGTGGSGGSGGTGGVSGTGGMSGTGGTGGMGGSGGSGGMSGTGGGCAGTGDPEWTPLAPTTPNCVANIFGDYLLRKDGYLLYETATQQIPIVNEQGALISDWVEAFSGSIHGCGLRSNGEVWCWGLNASADAAGQLGDGTVGGTTTLHRASRVLKAAADPLTNIVHMATGEFSPEATCAIDLVGKLWCWGELQYLAGNGASQATAYATPIKVDATTDIDRVQHMVFSAQHACLLRLDPCDQREVWCWGANGNGQAGTGNMLSPIQYPTRVVGLTDPSTLAMAYVDATCAIDGARVKCWGHNWQGATGTGSKSNTATLVPSLVRKMDGTFLTGVVQIVGGSNDICALDASGAMWCWGYYYEGYAAPYTQAATPVTGVAAMGLSNLASQSAPRYLTTDGNYHLGATVRVPDCNPLE